MRRRPHNQLDFPRDTSQYVLAGPVTFRRASRMLLSSRYDTAFNNFGGARQNIEKSMRSIWWADKGYKLCQVDQSGADALIVAYLCRAGKYRSLFLHGVKPHVYIALHRFPSVWMEKFGADNIKEALAADIPTLVKFPFWKELSSYIKSSDDWPGPKRYYYMGKKIAHAFSYGMRGNRLQMALLEESEGQVVITNKEAESYIAETANDFPEILQWHSVIFEQAKKYKCLRNLLGWPLNITWFVNSSDMKDLYAWIPQSTVASITQMAMIKLQEYIEKERKDWHILQETHDSYLAEAKEEEIGELKDKMLEFMQPDLVAPDGTPFKMKAAASYGYNWGAYKESNLEGMKEL